MATSLPIPPPNEKRINSFFNDALNLLQLSASGLVPNFSSCDPLLQLLAHKLNLLYNVQTDSTESKLLQFVTSPTPSSSSSAPYFSVAVRPAFVLPNSDSPGCWCFALPFLNFALLPPSAIKKSAKTSVLALSSTFIAPTDQTKISFSSSSSSSNALAFPFAYRSRSNAVHPVIIFFGTTENPNDELVIKNQFSSDTICAEKFSRHKAKLEAQRRARNLPLETHHFSPPAPTFFPLTTHPIVNVWIGDSDDFHLLDPIGGLTHKRFKIVDSLEEADVIWSAENNLKNRDEETIKGKFVNQFLYEGAFVMKDNLCRELQNQWGEGRSWCVEGYDLDCQFDEFVGRYNYNEDKVSAGTLPRVERAFVSFYLFFHIDVQYGVFLDRP